MTRARINLTRPVNWSHPLNVGRVSWWLSLPQWGFGGNTWHDLCRRNNGTLTNGPTWRPASRPGGWGELAFTNTGNTYVQIGTFALTGTIAFSLKATAGGISGNNIFSNASGTDTIQADGSNNLGIFDGATHSSGIVIVAGEWRRFVLVWTGSNSYVLYRDGANVATITTNRSILTERMGRSVACMTMSLDDITIWNRALSASEVALDYDLSRRGYPGVLNRVRRAIFSVSSQPPPPSGGGLVCATVGLAARVDATANLASRVNATVSLSPRVNATADVQEC